MTMTRTFGKTLGAVVATVLYLNAAPVAGVDGKPVWVEPVVRQSVQPHSRVTGSLRASARAEIAALEEGALVEVTVDEADVVRNGDVLARTDARRLDALRAQVRARVAQAEAEQREGRAELVFAERDYAALRVSFERNAISEQSMRKARAALDVARAQLAAAQRKVESVAAEIVHLDVRLADTVIRAPFDGRVVERHAEPGEWIKAGEPVVTLVASGKVEAWLEVPERYAPYLFGHAEPIAVEVGATRERHQASGARVIPQIDRRARTFVLVADLEDHDGRLAAGMSVSAWVPTEALSSFITVPRDALVRDGAGDHVYKVAQSEAGDTSVKTPVKVLFETGEVAAVFADDELRPGDLVVVEGNERLQPGDPVLLSVREQLPETKLAKTLEPTTPDATPN